ncbi:hypothetical protein SETIT_1G185500v2 [Setaria italica]|uniref:Uncharacterized protein n=1 Tax=Setaria italica TaxID=4555 RepID=A0A368PM75_SETIT|nr:hypothetical protein SETIT_1G185500v2 [Setaria italica]
MSCASSPLWVLVPLVLVFVIHLPRCTGRHLHRQAITEGTIAPPRPTHCAGHQIATADQNNRTGHQRAASDDRCISAGFIMPPPLPSGVKWNMEGIVADSFVQTAQ